MNEATTRREKPVNLSMIQSWTEQKLRNLEYSDDGGGSDNDTDTQSNAKCSVRDGTNATESNDRPGVVKSSNTEDLTTAAAAAKPTLSMIDVIAEEVAKVRESMIAEDEEIAANYRQNLEELIIWVHQRDGKATSSRERRKIMLVKWIVNRHTEMQREEKRESEVSRAMNLNDGAENEACIADIRNDMLFK